MQLIATRPFTYQTRRLVPGDVFTAEKPMDGKLLIAVKKARLHREPGSVAPPPAALKAQIAAAPGPSAAPVEAEPEADPEQLSQLDHDGDGKAGGSVSPPPSEDLTALRAEYFETVGKRPFNGWDAVTLRDKIAEHGQGDG